MASAHENSAKDSRFCGVHSWSVVSVLFHLPFANKFNIIISASAASAVRMAKSIEGGGNPDATYHLFQVQLWTFVNSSSLHCLDKLTDGYAREVEITTGLICGCLPILPALFRHMNPRIQSKISSTAGSNLPKLGKRSFLSSRHSNCNSKYLGPDDPRLLYAEYLELEEGNHKKSYENGGTVTTIRGGVSSEDIDANTIESHLDDDHDGLKRQILVAGTGILKTVRVESTLQEEPLQVSLN